MVAFPGTRHDGVLYPPIVYHHGGVSGQQENSATTRIRPGKEWDPVKRTVRLVKRFVAYITLRNGRRIYARDYGKRAFVIYVPA